MQNVKRVLAMILAVVMILTVFPGAAMATQDQSQNKEEPAHADLESNATDTAKELISQADPTQEDVETPKEETETPAKGDEAAQEEPKEGDSQVNGADKEIIGTLEYGAATLTVQPPNGTVFTGVPAFEAHSLEAEYEDLEDICLNYDILCILDYFAFDMNVSGVSFPGQTVTVDISFADPYLMTIAPTAIKVFQYVDGKPVLIPAQATVNDNRVSSRIVIEPEIEWLNSKYIVLTTDAPNPLLEVGTQVAYMAVNTLNNKRVGLSGNGISFTTSGIMWHYISDQRKPAICLQPNKTFQTSNAAAYYTENTTLSGSSTSSVGGNVWNNLTKAQRRLIGLILLYGVETNWDNSVGNAGLNTAYNLQSPTNPNQCLFAAQQIMAWEVITGNRSASYPYTCTDSTLINAFGGNVPTKYAWLESQIRAHDSATSTIPSPENSTYRLAWLSSGFQSVIQVVDVQYETPAPPTASLTIRKTSATATGTNATQKFSFKIFTNSGLTNQVGSTQNIAPGKNFSVTLDAGKTYYVAEVAQTGWNCTTPGVSTKTVSGVTYYYQSITPSAGGSYSLTFNNEPEIVKKNITLQKNINASTACVNLIKDNAMYSLAGAEYSISLNGVVQETLVTDANGKATSSKTYNVGAVLTIKETKAPKGFKLDSTAYTHTMIDGTNTVTVSDVPLFDPPFILTKVDAATTVPQGNGSFSGAVFKWEYFDNTNWTGAAKATWYFTTNASGRVQYDPSYLASGYTSSDLYSPAANSYQLPLGSLKITEVKNPIGYTVIKNPLYCTITQDSSSTLGVAVTWNADSLKTLVNIASGNYGVPEPIDTTLFGSVMIQKVDSQTGNTSQGAASLEGAEFEVTNSSTSSIVIGGTTYAPGKVCLKLTTDSSGSASSGNVLPIGKYTIRETKAPEGYSLNTQWVQEFTVTEKTKDYTYSMTTNNGCPDTVIRGGLQIIKQDANKLATTDANAPLNGITFSVVNSNEHPVVVDGKSYPKGGVVMTLEITWNGNMWCASTAANALPYGTYLVRENPMMNSDSMANEHYSLNMTPQTITIQKEGEMLSLTFTNESKPGKISIEKVNHNGSYLSGAAFLLQWSEDGESWQRVVSTATAGQKGGCTTNGIKNGVLKVPESGVIEFTGLNTSLYYRVLEVEAPNGYSLLTEPAFVGKLPAESAEISLKVVNEPDFSLPQTGAESLMYTTVLASLFAFCGVALLVTRKKWN